MDRVSSLGLIFGELVDTKQYSEPKQSKGFYKIRKGMTSSQDVAQITRHYSLLFFSCCLFHSFGTFSSSSKIHSAVQ